MKRRNVDNIKLRRNIKRNRISDGFCSGALVYIKFLLVWAFVMTADFLLEFRFEFLWPFWLLLRSVYDSCRYQGLAFSVFFVCIAITSDMVCFLFIPMQWLFFLASTYVWVQYVWHTDRTVCLPTVCLWCLFVYIEAAVRLKELKNMPFTLDLCRPFAAHCIGYPVVTLGFGVKSYVGYKYKLRKQREISKENDFYMQLLQEALPAEHRAIEDTALKALSYKSDDHSRISNGVLMPVPAQNHLVPNSSAPSSDVSGGSFCSKRPVNVLTDKSLSGTLNNHRKRSVLPRTSSPGDSASGSLRSRSNAYLRFSSVSQENSTANGNSYSAELKNRQTPGVWGWLMALFMANDNYNEQNAASESMSGAVESFVDLPPKSCDSYVYENSEDEESTSSAEDLRQQQANNSSSGFGFGECLLRRFTGSWMMRESSSNNIALQSGDTSRTTHRLSSNTTTSNGVQALSSASYQKSSKASSRSRGRSEQGRHRGGANENLANSCASVNDSLSSCNQTTKDQQSQSNIVSLYPDAATGKDKVQNKDLALALSLESDVEKLKSDLRTSRILESELRQQIHQLTQGDKSVKNELQQLRQNNEQLQTKLHNLVRARQQDKQTITGLEKRITEEVRNRSALEAQVQQEKKLKKAEESAAARIAASTVVARSECNDNCKTQKRELETELKAIKRELRQREDYVRQLESELHSLRKYNETHDTDVLMSALSSMQDKNAHLENSLSAETRIKLDLFSALGEAKRQLEITQNQLSKKEMEYEELRRQYNDILMTRRGGSPMTPPPSGPLHVPDHLAGQSPYAVHTYRQGPMYKEVGISNNEYVIPTTMIPQDGTVVTSFMPTHATGHMQ